LEYADKGVIMPIFEYKCNDCEEKFEKLVLSTTATTPECPSCKEGNVKKLVSAGCVRPNGSGSAGMSDFGAANCAPSGG
jgi:putative FmdB family regulatory protein